MSINRVEDFLTESARRFGDKIALVAGGRRLSFAELDAAVRPPRGRSAARRCSARRSRPHLHGQLLGSGGLDLRRAEGRRRIQPDQSLDQGGQARFRRRQLPRGCDPHADEAACRRSRRAEGLSEPRADDGCDRREGRSPAGLRVVRRRLRSAQRSAAARRHRSRPGDADLHLRLDRLPEGRDDDASEHRRGGHIDHHLSRRTPPTTSSSTCCRSRSTTASIRC